MLSAKKYLKKDFLLASVDFLQSQQKREGNPCRQKKKKEAFKGESIPKNLSVLKSKWEVD